MRSRSAKERAALAAVAAFASVTWLVLLVVAPLAAAV